VKLLAWRSFPRGTRQGLFLSTLTLPNRLVKLTMPLLVESIDEGIQPAVLESMLFYFWFRCTALRRNLHEYFFQKLERHWDAVMERVNGYLATWPEKLTEV